jgi:hypothetical protein
MRVESSGYRETIGDQSFILRQPEESGEKCAHGGPWRQGSAAIAVNGIQKQPIHCAGFR